MRCTNSLLISLMSHSPYSARSFSSAERAGFPYSACSFCLTERTRSSKTADKCQEVQACGNFVSICMFIVLERWPMDSMKQLAPPLYILFKATGAVTSPSCMTSLSRPQQFAPPPYILFKATGAVTSPSCMTSLSRPQQFVTIYHDVEIQEVGKGHTNKQSNRP